MTTYNYMPNQYLSETFLEIWKLYEQKLKNLKTRAVYMSAINRLCDFTQTDFLFITDAQANSYFIHLAKEHQMTIKTLNNRLSSFRSIGRFIYQDNIKEHFLLKDYVNPFEIIRVESYSEYIKPSAVPTLSELDLIMRKASSNNMLFLIFALILRCGLSARDVCCLNAEHFRTDELKRMFITFEKPHKQRIVKVPDDVLKLLIDYCNQHNCTSGPLFYNKKGKPLGYHALSDLVRDTMSEVGLSYTMQDLRNTSIAYMLHGGAENGAVAEYTGISERWMFRYQEVLPSLDAAPCDFQCFQIVKPH